MSIDFMDTASASTAMAKKEIKPRRLAAAEDAEKLREAFVRYLRSECHLAENSVVAYERDLRRFFEWLLWHVLNGRGDPRQCYDGAIFEDRHGLAPCSTSQWSASRK